jgi:hypothetical protein
MKAVRSYETLVTIFEITVLGIKYEFEVFSKGIPPIANLM